MIIRKIEESDDKPAISHIYEASWKFAYKDIIPQSFLDSIPVGNWVSHLENAEMDTLVALEGNKIIGTSSYCKSRFSDFADFGELVSIYLLPEYIGKGYGKALLEATVSELITLGFKDIFLWVLEDNMRARRFYEKAGFVLSEYFLDDNIHGKALREIQYCYHVE